MKAERLFSIFYENTHLLVLVIVLLVVAGLSALFHLPRLEDPRITNRFSTIITPMPGQSAKNVEALVTEPIETELQRLPQLGVVISDSYDGLSVINVELKETVTDVLPVWSKVRDLLADARGKLPVGAGHSRFIDDRGYASSLMLAFVDTQAKPHETEHLLNLSRYAQALRKRLISLPGTEVIHDFGFPEEEILVAVDPIRLAELHLTLAQVVARLKAYDTKVSAGTLKSQGEYLIEVDDHFTSIEKLKQVIVKSDNSGIAVPLGDIATVIKRQAKQLPEGSTFIGRQPAVILALRALPEASIDVWGKSVQQEVEKFSSQLPSNIQIKPIFSQEKYITARYRSLIINLIFSFVLIILVLLLTFGVRTAFIISLTLPLTCLFTLIGLRLIGLPIHQMSITGMIVALGIMIDNAIVIVDAIKARLQTKSAPIVAVQESIAHLWLPLLGATITTILAFQPIILLPGSAGEFVGGIAWSVIFALVGSYLIAHTIIAALAGRLLVKTTWDTPLISYVSLTSLRNRFNRSILWSTRPKNRVKIILSVVLFVGLGLASKTFMQEQFFPPADRDQFQISFRLPVNAGEEQTQQLRTAAQALLESQPEISQIVWYVGASAAPYYYNFLQIVENRPNYLDAMVTAKNASAAAHLVKHLQSTLQNEFPQAMVLVKGLEQGPPFIAPVEIRLTSPDLNKLYYYGQQIRQQMMTIPGVRFTRARLEVNKQKLSVMVDPLKAQQLGLAPRDLAVRLSQLTDGVVAGHLLEGLTVLPVRVRLAKQFRDNLNDIKHLPLSLLSDKDNSTLDVIPLSSIATVSLRPAWSVITRRNSQRINVIGVYIEPDVLPATILRAWRNKYHHEIAQLSSKISLAIDGENEERNEAVGNLLASVPVIIVMFISVLILIFRSLAKLTIVLATTVIAVASGIFSVWLSGYPFGFTVIIALLGLVGLAINGAIVILCEIRRISGINRSSQQLVARATLNCSRHIFSTMLTTVFGFVPLIVGGGGFWPPFAVALAGGILMTTLLSFYIVPAMYCTLYRVNQEKGRVILRATKS